MKALPYNISNTDIEFGNLLKDRKMEFAEGFSLNLNVQEKTLALSSINRSL
ncbi:hypothetical protein [Chitinophaga polysaccharea]|uniref:hypothetical protein n=1 Tax=Chitinophaga polysaccharea TaxID=1293035 RepID=UPI00163BD89A|nr:hypothetical protein [Chitinophaga polysaccharea]